MSLFGVVLAMDQGYGRMSLLEEMLRKGVCSATIFPYQIRSRHPFVVKRILRTKRKPEFDEDDSDKGISTGTGGNEVNGASNIDKLNIKFDT